MKEAYFPMLHGVAASRATSTLFVGAVVVGAGGCCPPRCISALSIRHRSSLLISGGLFLGNAPAQVRRSGCFDVAVHRHAIVERAAIGVGNVNVVVFAGQSSSGVSCSYKGMLR